MLFIETEFGIESDLLLKEFIVSAAVAGAIVGSIGAAFVNERFGRRLAIILSCIVFIGGAALMAFAATVWELIAGRFLAGIGIGIASMSVPIYIAEMAPCSIRGALVSVDVMLITGGQFISYGVDAALINVPHNWRWMLGLSAIPAIVQLIGMLFLPESPRWLVGKDKSNEAQEVLARIRRSNVVAAQEVRQIEASIEEERIQRRAAANGRGEDEMSQGQLERVWQETKLWFTSPTLRKALIVGVGLQVFQQLCGINTVMYYSPTILKMAGFGQNSDAIYSSMAVAFANMTMTLVAIFTIDRVGRRPLLLGSLIGVYCSLLLLAISFALPEDSGRWLALSALIMYIVCFAPGMGPVPWAINAEIYPLHARAIGGSIASTSNWISNLIVSATFLHLIETAGATGAFLVYALIAVFAFEFVYFIVPETKGLSLEEVRQV
eukprot:TRINITY_DN4532_c0_g1_i2.p1 TRINITY_DN4532_c0_g1~~TRINITY_DN4532_c0_g1_i2.p1  ORF type:complete len:437 (-),score=85.55 TRINITY_DN4532_c0_g1_i2:154-1464(-)